MGQSLRIINDQLNLSSNNTMHMTAYIFHIVQNIEYQPFTPPCNFRKKA